MSLRLPPEDYAALCQVIFNRDGWKCRSCGSRNSLCVHHVVYRSQSGPDEPWNLITLCSACHDGVHKDVKNGEYGLTIWVFPEDGVVHMRRRSDWRPQ